MGNQLMHVLQESECEHKNMVELYGRKLSKKNTKLSLGTIAGRLPELQKLIVNECRVKSLPSDVNLLMFLTELNMQGNLLSSLPALDCLKNLQILKLSHNAFTKFPDEIGGLPSLEYFDLSNNSIQVVGTSASKLTKLKSLLLYGNHLTEFPEVIFGLQSLETLNMGRNRISKIPEQISVLTNLLSLNISQNEVKDIDIIGLLTQLQTLNLSGNRLSGIPESEFENLNALLHLDLSYCNILSLPDPFYFGTQIRVLKLNGNKILHLGDLGDLKNLTDLHIQDNQLVKLSKSLLKCKNLERLHCEFNSITKLPSNMASLTKLRYFTLHYNKFKVVPESLRDLQLVRNLHVVSLEDNPFPEEIRRIIHTKGTKAYLSTKEETHEKTKKSYRPSLSRLASQYGTLRGRPAPMHDLFFTEETPSPTSPEMNRGTSSRTLAPTLTRTLTSRTPDLMRKSPDRRRILSNVDQSSGKLEPESNSLPTSDVDKKTKTLRGFMTRRSSMMSLKPTEQKEEIAVEPKKSHRKNSLNIPLAKTANRTLTLVEFLEKHREYKMPLYAKFKDTFESILDEIGIKEMRKSELKAASSDVKWRLLQVYRQDLTKLLGISTVEDEDREKHFEEILKSMNLLDSKTALNYILAKLQTLEVPMKTMASIKRALSAAHVKWIYAFLCGGGVDYIAEMLHKLYQKNWNPEDIVMENELVSSLHMLSHASTDTFIFSKSAMDMVVNALTSFQMATQRMSIEILIHLLNKNKSALYAVLHALDRLRIVKGIKNRFSIIMQILEKAKDIQNDTKLKTFNLICTIIQAENDLLERFLLRNEFFALGLKEFLSNTSLGSDETDIQVSDLNYKIVEFGRLQAADSNEVKTLMATDYRVLERVRESEKLFSELTKEMASDDKVVKKKSHTNVKPDNEMASIKESVVKKKRPHSIHLGDSKSPLRRSSSLKNLNDKSNRKSEDRALKQKRMSQKSFLKTMQINPQKEPEKKVENVQGTFRVIISDFGSSSMFYNETTTVSQITQKILNKYPITNSESFGLFLLSTDSDQHEGFWVEDFDSKLVDLISRLGTLNVSSCVGSYKMKPWHVTLDCLFQQKQFEEDLEPTWSVVQSLAYIATKCRFPLDEEYELSIHFKASSNPDLVGKSLPLPETNSLMCLLEEPYGLTTTQIIEGKDCILEIGYKPCAMKIALSPNIIRLGPERNPNIQSLTGEEFVVVDIDYRWKEKDILQAIALKIQEITNIDEYCLCFESKRTTKKRYTSPNKQRRRKGITLTSMRNDSTQVRFSSGCLYENFFNYKNLVLRLCLLPRTVFVLLPTEETISIQIIFSSYLSEVIQRAVESLDESERGKSYSIYYGDNLLSRRKTLIETGIKHEDVLALKQEELNYTDKTRLMDAITKSETDATSESTTDFPTPTMNYDTVDINIYDEGDGEEFIVYEDEDKKVIAAATLNKIIEKLTDPNDYDDAFLETFLFTYQSFASQDQLLHKIIQRYNVPESYGEIADTIKVRVFIFLTRWIDQPYNKMSERILEKANIWIENNVVDSRQNILLQTLNKARAKLEMKETPIPPIEITIPESRLIEKDKISLWDLNDETIARQLTRDVWNLYTQLKPAEFFNTKDKENCPNITLMIDKFNRISSWVATELCTEPRLKLRRKKLKRFIKIASHLKEMRNFHILYAFISALYSIPVSRLKYTFEKMGKSRTILQELETLLSMDGSFKVYREMLKTNTTCIPIIALPLKDLTFVEDGNPNMINGLINWSKHKLFFEVVGGYLKYSLVEFKLAPVIVNGVHISDILDNLATLDETTLYDMSLQAEPRGAKLEHLK